MALVLQEVSIFEKTQVVVWGFFSYISGPKRKMQNFTLSNTERFHVVRNKNVYSRSTSEL